MNIYCTEEFKKEFTRLVKNNSHASLESEIIREYCSASFEDACSGDLLGVFPTANPTVLFVKKRIEGSGGFRVYCLAIINKENIYLGFVHPKSGKHGGDNITPEKKKSLLKELLAARDSGQVYEVKADQKKKETVVFSTPDIAEVVTRK